MKNKAIFIFGPTASGKTSLALNISDNYNVHLINVDASQVYIGMDIGSAKLSKAELAKYPHALIDICDPAQAYSSGQFREDAKKELKNALAFNKIPVFVGGTMLYFKQLLTNASNLPESDTTLRKELEKLAMENGQNFLFAELEKIDSQAAKNIDRNNLPRLIRALEIYKLTSKTPSQIWAEQAESLNEILQEWDFLQIGLMPNDRAKLHSNISLRWEQMIKNGFIDEVEGLKKRRDLNLDLPSMRAVGYRQIWQYLDGQFDFNSMNEKGKAATRQLAKRQITWLRSWRNAQIYASENNRNNELVLQCLDKFL